MTGWSQHLEQSIREACRLEVTASKPGNVHPEASFPDLRWTHFVRSGELVAPILARTTELGVGRAILEAITATRTEIPSNTNLGIVLLLAPMAAVPQGVPLRAGVGAVLGKLTRDDASLVYEAIRRAVPGGMGKAVEGDVTSGPTGTLLEMMRLAAGRDQIAAEYATDFDTVLNVGLPFLAGCSDWPGRWEADIITLQLQLMASHPDTLIGRKRGSEEARESARRAAAVLRAGGPDSAAGRELLVEFDQWLRAVGNGRNPGTTADLVTACLFAALREGVIAPVPQPLR